VLYAQAFGGNGQPELSSLRTSSLMIRILFLDRRPRVQADRMTCLLFCFRTYYFGPRD